jgi:Leucine rich repeat
MLFYFNSLTLLTEMIYLTENQVRGTIPSSFGQLKQLKRIQMSRNSIEGTLPSELGQLQEHLEVLSMGRNSLSGTIPSQLGLLTKLMELNLAENSFTGDVPQELIELEALSILRLEENDLGGSIPEGMCNKTATDAQPGTKPQFSVDCEQVQCSCCVECCLSCGLGGANDSLDQGSDAIVFAPTPTPSPTKDPLVYPVAPSPAANFDCYSAAVGFSCYNPNFAIDFETSVCNPQAHDMIAVFAVAAAAGTSLVGSQRSIDDAAVWATSCTLPECDGVISNGSLFYRNVFPERFQDAASWPLPIGTNYVLTMIHVDASGTATILAQSTPFVVAENCP